MIILNIRYGIFLKKKCFKEGILSERKSKEIIKIVKYFGKKILLKKKNRQIKKAILLCAFCDKL